MLELKEMEKPRKRYFENLVPNCTLIVSILPSWGFRIKCFETLERTSIWERIIYVVFLALTGLGVAIDVYFWKLNPSTPSGMKGVYTVVGFLGGVSVALLLVFLLRDKVNKWEKELLIEAEEKNIVWESPDFVVRVKNYEMTKEETEKNTHEKRDFHLIDKIGVLYLYDGFEHVVDELDMGKKVEHMQRVLYRFHPSYFGKTKNKVIVEIPVAYTFDFKLISLLSVGLANPFTTYVGKYPTFALASLLDYIVQSFPELEDQGPVYYMLGIGEVFFKGGAPLTLDSGRLLGTIP